MKKEIIFKAIPVTERQPEQTSSIHVVLLDGRIPMMAQYNPQGWCYLSGIPATKGPQLIGGKGVSHWLEKQNSYLPEKESLPPIVRAAISCLEHTDLSDYNWAGVYQTGWLYAFDQEPVYRHLEEEWWRSDLNDIQIELGCFGETLMQGMDSKLLLLKRNGLQWEWVYREEYRNSQ